MAYKENIKNFFLRFKRVIVTTSICALAFAIVGVVAIKSTGNISTPDKTVSTSAPTTINFVMPVKNGEIIKDFSNTALKYNSTLKQWEAHKAVDIKGADDADVLAVYDGTVVSVETTYLNGTVVTIKHNKSLQTVYASLAENVQVKAGDKVKKGQVIGKVSNSAKSESADGNHLHFEVWHDGVKVDPNLYLITSEK